jgi:hypothetical protein
MSKMKKIQAQLLVYLKNEIVQGIIAVIVAFYLCSLLDH